MRLDKTRPRKRSRAGGLVTPRKNTTTEVQLTILGLYQIQPRNDLSRSARSILPTSVTSAHNDHKWPGSGSPDKFPERGEKPVLVAPHVDLGVGAHGLDDLAVARGSVPCNTVNVIRSVPFRNLSPPSPSADRRCGRATCSRRQPTRCRRPSPAARDSEA